MYRIVKRGRKYHPQKLVITGWRDIQYWSYRDGYQLLWPGGKNPQRSFEAALEILYGYVLHEKKQKPRKEVVATFTKDEDIVRAYEVQNN